MKSNSSNTFREDEVVMMSHWDKQAGANVTTPYPKISGRLRLAHEHHEQLSVTTEIVSYDGSVAVVTATATTGKGIFSGIGMASLERDNRIAPAILELAETRAIARALRFAGFGVEYCSAEEISHLESGQNGGPQQGRGSISAPQDSGHGSGFPGADTSAAGGLKPPAGNNGGNGANGNGRITARQLGFIMKLANGQGVTRKELNERCLTAYGAALDFLSKNDASSLIKGLSH